MRAVEVCRLRCRGAKGCCNGGLADLTSPGGIRGFAAGGAKGSVISGLTIGAGAGGGAEGTAPSVSQSNVANMLDVSCTADANRLVGPPGAPRPLYAGSLWRAATLEAVALQDAVP